MAKEGAIELTEPLVVEEPLSPPSAGAAVPPPAHYEVPHYNKNSFNYPPQQPRPEPARQRPSRYRPMLKLAAATAGALTIVQGLGIMFAGMITKFVMGSFVLAAGLLVLGYELRGMGLKSVDTFVKTWVPVLTDDLGKFGLFLFLSSLSYQSAYSVTWNSVVVLVDCAIAGAHAAHYYYLSRTRSRSYQYDTTSTNYTDI